MTNPSDYADRVYGYNVDDGGVKPYLVIAEIEDDQSKAPKNSVLATSYSELHPLGCHGPVPIAFLRTEVPELMAHAAVHWFDDGVDVSGMAKEFPTFIWDYDWNDFTMIESY